MAYLGRPEQFSDGKILDLENLENLDPRLWRKSGNSNGNAQLDVRWVGVLILIDVLVFPEHVIFHWNLDVLYTAYIVFF